MKLHYKSFLQTPPAFGAVATADRAIIGYACLTKSAADQFTSLLQHSLLPLIANSLFLLLHQPGPILTNSINVLRKILFSRKPLPKSAPPRPMNCLAQPAPLFELHPLVVRHDFQGSAVAPAILSFCEDYLRQQGESAYYLRVTQNNYRAIRFYKKVGFHYSCINNENNIVMEKKLLP